MAEQGDFWLGLQRERTGLSWTRTLEALTAAQVVVAVDGLKSHRVGPAIVGILLLVVTISLVWWQYRTSHAEHGADATSPATHLASTCSALVLLAFGGLLMVLA